MDSFASRQNRGELHYVREGDEDRGLKTIEKGEFCSEVCVGRACPAYTSTKSSSEANVS